MYYVNITKFDDVKFTLNSIKLLKQMSNKSIIREYLKKYRKKKISHFRNPFSSNSSSPISLYFRCNNRGIRNIFLY